MLDDVWLCCGVDVVMYQLVEVVGVEDEGDGGGDGGQLVEGVVEGVVVGGYVGILD